ncbi:MAG: GHKL domain-containing protein [Bacilli bacterium]
MTFGFIFKVSIYIALSILSLYTLNSLLNQFLYNKRNLPIVIKLLMNLFLLTLATSTHFIKYNPAINVIISVVLTLGLATYRFKSDIKRKFVIAISWITVAMITELVVSFLYNLFLDKLIKININVELYNLTGAIVTSIINLVLVKSFSMYRNKKTSYEKFEIADSLQVVAIPICSILILHSYANVFDFNFIESQTLMALPIIAIIFINIFFYYLFDKLKENEKIKYENEIFKSKSEYYITLEKNTNSTYDKMRIVKHDLNYHLLFLKSKIKENNAEALLEAKNKIDILLDEVLEGKLECYTKNQKLNTILNHKLSQFSEEYIDIRMNICVLENAIIDESSLYIILGNALDNVKNYFNNINLTNKKLFINILDDESNLYIKIKNTLLDKLEFRNDLPVTTNNDKFSHGIGLKSIKHLVEEKNGYFKISTENNLFSLEILLYEEITYK